MAEFHRNEHGIGYLILTHEELVSYSQIESPVCDECIRRLRPEEPIMLIPYANEAYCMDCGEYRLEDMIPYPADRPIQEKREQFFKDFYGIEE